MKTNQQRSVWVALKTKLCSMGRVPEVVWKGLQISSARTLASSHSPLASVSSCGVCLSPLCCQPGHSLIDSLPPRYQMLRPLAQDRSVWGSCLGLCLQRRNVNVGAWGLPACVSVSPHVNFIQVSWLLSGSPSCGMKLRTKNFLSGITGMGRATNQLHCIGKPLLSRQPHSPGVSPRNISYFGVLLISFHIFFEMLPDLTYKDK